MSRKIKTGVMYRSGTLEIDDDHDRSVRLAFSSEAPVERMWGTEVLDHGVSSVRMGFLKSGRAPLLVDHDPSDQVGVVEDAAISSDRVGRATVRFGKSTRAEEILRDVKDGIRANVSVGYRIHKLKLERQGGDQEVYRAVDWEPIELTITSIPADMSVGIGRSAEDFETEIERPADAGLVTSEVQKMSDPIQTEPSVNVTEVRHQAAEAERSRVREILAVGAKFNQAEMAQRAIESGTSVADFNASVLREMGVAKPIASPEIGMTEKETRSFSFVKLIAALANPGDRGARNAAAFELEACEAQAQKLGRSARGAFLPEDVLRRDLVTGTTTSTAKGGNLVATDLLSGSFIDALRNRMVTQQAGATMLTGLVGNVAIPKKTTASTSYWVAENVAPTEGSLVFGQVTMSPKTLAAYVDFSRRLSIQSSLDIENLVRNDLVNGIAVTLDEAALGGAKTNGPTGVRGTSGIGSVALATNGGAPTWAMITALEREVEIDNALTGAGAYITNPKVRYKLKNTLKSTADTASQFLLASNNELNGYPLLVSNQIPSTLTKGSSSVCSALLFGVWSDLMIGQWSGIDILVDPYSGSSAATTRVTAFVDVDVAVRYPESFAACVDITTA